MCSPMTILSYLSFLLLCFFVVGGSADTPLHPNMTVSNNFKSCFVENDPDCQPPSCTDMYYVANCSAHHFAYVNFTLGPCNCSGYYGYVNVDVGFDAQPSTPIFSFHMPANETTEQSFPLALCQERIYLKVHPLYCDAQGMPPPLRPCAYSMRMWYGS
eukprot:m.270061 g.270061  ORF g.270061 m.270061 type:complete len:158 (+) comp45376_c0_seq1:112-585(+)